MGVRRRSRSLSLVLLLFFLCPPTRSSCSSSFSFPGFSCPLPCPRSCLAGLLSSPALLSSPSPFPPLVLGRLYSLSPVQRSPPAGCYSWPPTLFFFLLHLKFLILDDLKLFPQMPQLCGRSTVWCCWCDRSSVMELSRRLQSTHVHGIVAACVWMCLRSESTQATVAPHATQARDLSSRWDVFWCIFRALFWMKHLPQVSQLKGRSPVWIRWWPLRVSAWLKLLPHVSHLNGFSPVWMRRWRCRLPWMVKLLLQYWQL
uniref:Secreted protein n=1 Tax=Stegastes partitus TaxID=144197 RepID=A0A3B5BJH2_9TELE